MVPALIILIIIINIFIIILLLLNIIIIILFSPKTSNNNNTKIILLIKISLFHEDKIKLTRNKNARHIFPHHYFPVAMIGIICLHMHFVLYTSHTRSIFLYITSGNMTITAQNARARRAFQPRGCSKQFVLTLLRSFTEQKT